MAGGARLGRDERETEAEPRRLGEPLRQVADPTQLAGEPELADRDQVGGHRRVSPCAEAIASAVARSPAGSLIRAPPTVETKTSWLCSRMPGALLQHRHDHRDAGAVDARRSYAAAARPTTGVTSACTSASIGRRPSSVDRDAGARDRLVVPGDEQPGRVGDRDDAVAGEVEAADLVDRAEAVLHRADHPQPGAALALEVQHHVDEVLEHPRAGDAAVLGDVADHASSAMFRVLATRTSAAATSLTWVTPPGTPSTSAAPMVCTESTTSSWGRTASTWPSTAPRSVSAAR